ncbi:MAG: HAMP domain-containing sensor histidine kinase [Candidatus Omnitrophica bacterium]|nr:HAMP domain-containing sensor histidine kinase [Candidatus Omnitrophota bacterium]
MRLKIALIFILSILIPTALLSYFGLKAVRSEKVIVESSIKQRYEAMANIVESEIDATLSGLSPELLKDRPFIESIISDQASLFKGQIVILNNKGSAVGGTGAAKDRGQLMVMRPMRNLPYTIAAYERFPLLIEKYEARKQGLYAYITTICAAAIAILAGALFTLGALSRQWRLAELKSEFVAGLSHDLRKPLTSIRMFSEMLKDGLVPGDGKKEEYYKIINTESERLTQLANNILDFSRIETGSKKHRFKEEDIGKLVKDTADYFLSYNLDEKRPISVSIEKDLPRVKSDAGAISQAVLNLLSNAVKYSPPAKPIKVNVRKRAKEIVVEVIDEGVGIPRNEQKKIFRKFYRVQNLKSEVEGSGLGLALVKYAAEIHGGHVELLSELNKGSKFTLVLPL